MILLLIFLSHSLAASFTIVACIKVPYELIDFNFEWESNSINHFTTFKCEKNFIPTFRDFQFELLQKKFAMNFIKLPLSQRNAV